jgi:glycosyltransferase involved in cell wall biosynthesis
VNPSISVVIPTRDRVEYLKTTLGSLAGQQIEERYEVVVADDCSADESSDVARAAGARSVRHERPLGANAARNSGILAARADLVALIDDDVWAPPGWLAAYLEGARAYPDAEAFGGPIRARFDGPAPRACGRERPPITTLDLGSDDVEARVVWSANMMVRRGAVDRVGPFDESLLGGGEEEDWLERLRAMGGRVVYLARAGLDHRRVGDDARLRFLVRSAWSRGRYMRAYDRRRGRPPSLMAELRVLAGCGWHTLRRGCPQGLIAGAHAAGRIVEAVRPR